LELERGAFAHPEGGWSEPLNELGLRKPAEIAAHRLGGGRAQSGAFNRRARGGGAGGKEEGSKRDQKAHEASCGGIALD
jgi:hypothetical protein